MASSDAARFIDLALAVAPAPLSIETLLGWNVARPAELWGALSTAQANGKLRQTEGAHFAYADAARRDDCVAKATPADWASLVGSADRIAWSMAAARAAAAERRFGVATALMHTLVLAKARDAFPDGERGWLAVVLQALRASRTMAGLPRAVLEDAVAVAVACGDLGAQGVLHGSLAAAALRDGRCEAARAHLALARETARTCTGPVQVEIQLYLAVGLALAGRPREAIECFEELLGDVPSDVEALVQTSSSAPATPLFVMALSYAAAGQVPRAFDLVQRIRAFGAERGVPALEREADLFASIAHATIGDFEGGRAHAQRAYDFYAGTNVDPVHLWFAASSLACVRAWEGRLDEVPALLARGLEARRASGWPFLGGTGALDLLERLDIDGIRIEGFTLDGELDRILAGANVFWRGAAHRYRARKLVRHAGPADLRAARRHIGAAIALLREAGAGEELTRALADAGALGLPGAETTAASGATGSEPRAPRSTSAPRSGPTRLSAILLELGRFGALAGRREGTWGEIAARLCHLLSAERCAIVERGEPPRLLAARGGSGPWRDAIAALMRERAPASAEALPPPLVAGDPPSGQLLVVPFAAEGRACWACLENRYAKPAVGPEDTELLEVLSVQLAVLLGNVALLQELTAARERLEAENRYWRSTRPATAPGSAIVGDSPALRAVLDLVGRVAPSTTPVLVTGETGVGKELIASEIHRQSPRREGPFIPVHVASLSPGLVSSGLFGHERGAFTGATEQAKGRFELAHGGTLFLDEIGELSLEDQVRLLRVLQQGAFERVGGTRSIRSDFRLVAATNRDLEGAVRSGRFREDLYFRIAGFPIRVPPLRDRREEIPTLGLFFMERLSRARGVRFEGIGEADMQRMVEYAWPGNVRELEHVIERAVLLSEPPRLQIPPLDAATRSPLAQTRTPDTAEWVTLAESERRYIAQVLRQTRGRITGSGGAAEVLGVKPSTLNFRIRKLGLLDELRQARTPTRASPS